MDLNTLFGLLTSAGPSALLALFIIATLRGDVITRRQYDEMQAELRRQLSETAVRETEWRDLALQSSSHVERLVNAAIPERRSGL